jgi:biotin synthase
MKTDILETLANHAELQPAVIEYLLQTDDPDLRAALMDSAYKMKLEHVGGEVYFRGIIEFSNQCARDCGYCGIRRSNEQVRRFRMPAQEIVKTAQWAYENKYASIVLQSGERRDDEFVEFVETVLESIARLTQGKLRVTLSLGEQSEETYRRWHTAGADRYLLRMETSNVDLYAAIHPDDQDHAARKRSLVYLRDAGYQVGTGVMIGLPGQTMADLVADILFFKEMDIDMIGMGPYLVHAGTPLAEEVTNYDPARQLELGLRMIALTRLHLKDVNIAATTALQALAPDGREQGLRAGANVIMPNLTGQEYREDYQLYDGKPCLDENAEQCRGCLKNRIDGIGETIALGRWGDAPHFIKRTQEAGH